MKREHYVLGFMFDENEHKVLLQISKCSWMNSRWNGIGVHIEEDELPIQALWREVNEETGIVTRCIDWKHVITMICPGGVVFIYSHSSELMLPKHPTEQKLLINDTGDLPIWRMKNIDWMIALCLEHPSNVVHVETTKLGID